MFWWNRDAGLLAIQYWFYYPFNEWVNHHEADWETRRGGVAGDPRAAARPTTARRATALGHLFFFHDSWMQPRRLVLQHGGADSGEEHAVVFVGGHGRMLAWDGPFSGGSYPLPGRYPRAGFEPRWFAPDEQLPVGARFLAPDDFQVIVLPEPDRLDGARQPELSWLRLPFLRRPAPGAHQPARLPHAGQGSPAGAAGGAAQLAGRPHQRRISRRRVADRRRFEQALRALPAGWLSRPRG